MVEITEEKLQSIATNAANEAVKAYQKAAPAPNTAGIVVTSDPADRPFKSLAEMASAVKGATITRNEDPRLKRIKSLELEAAMKANGSTEGVPADGGYLVDPTLAAEILKPMHESGPFSSRVRRLPVGSNSNYGWINGVDETSRVTGSRWGGVQGYRLAEAGTKTATKPKFRRINWELKKMAVVMVSTDELLADATQFSAIANTAAAEELDFMVNDDILNGDGLAGPQGILKSPALVSQLREDANKILHSDIVNMWSRLDPRSRGNSAWFINADSEAALMQLYFTGTTSVMSPYVGYTPAGVMTLMGRPVIVNEFSPAFKAANDVLLADLSQYLFWEKGGVQSDSNIYLYYLTDETAFRWVYRCDGQTSMASALTPYKGTATTSAFVGLSATSS